jgi:2-polyprenyl-6-methoxyphenol hydroxylase-like FAD-dependent oxidoreductase
MRLLTRAFSRAILVGGGPAGLTLANALMASASFASAHSVTLLEGSALPAAPEPGSAPEHRVFSLTRGSQNLLSSL